MAEILNNPAKIDGEVLETVTGNPDLSRGSVGLETQLPGRATTVTQIAEATGGIGAGNFIVPDIDEELFQFNKDDTPLMNLMLNAKKVKVNSPEVEHFMIDSERDHVVSIGAVAGGDAQAILPLSAEEKNIPRPFTTLLAKGVNGYLGTQETPGKDLLLLVTGHDLSTGNPIVRAMNGPKANDTDEFCNVPAIPAGTRLNIMSSALYETQKDVEPSSFVPSSKMIYLQKRGMNQVVSDYFDSQKKRIPFSKAILAEHDITNFKIKGNRTLWASRAGKVKINVPGMGMQVLYTTEGVRWQFMRGLRHTGKWTFEKIIGLTKMYYNGEDKPSNGILLSGQNLIEDFQCIDFSKHPEVQISVKTNKLGWEVTNLHTVFGDIQIKHDPTLDSLGYQNSGALLSEDRLVHYVYSQEHTFNEAVEGHEAKRSGILVWDGLGLKGSCHIWIDGEGEEVQTSINNYLMWDDASAPSGADLIDGMIYYLLQDCPGINAAAQTGQTWLYSDGSWSQFGGEIKAY